MNTDLLAKQIIQSTFNNFDKNQDGFLCIDELRQMVHDTFMNNHLDFELKKNNSAAFEKKLKEGTDSLMEKVDQDQDGKVSLQELEILMIPMINHLMNQE